MHPTHFSGVSSSPGRLANAAFLTKTSGVLILELHVASQNILPVLFFSLSLPIPIRRSNEIIKPGTD